MRGRLQNRVVKRSTRRRDLASSARFQQTWSARYHLTEETSRFIVSTGAPSSTISWTEREVARSKIATKRPCLRFTMCPGYGCEGKSANVRHATE